MEFKIKTLESKSELKEHFKRLAEPKLLIECNHSNSNQYKLIQIDSFTIGLISHSFGVPVQIDTLEDKSTFLIGHESEIDCVSSITAKVLWKVKVESVFFQFKKVSEKKCIVVVEEAGVLALDFRGNKVWSLPTDIITEYQITESTVTVKTIDEKETRITIQTGEILSQ